MANKQFNQDDRQKQADKLRAALAKQGAYPTAHGAGVALFERQGIERAVSEVLPDLDAADTFAVLAVALQLKDTEVSS